MNDSLGIGLVGAGAIAQAYVAAIREEPGMHLAGVADVRPEAAAATAESGRCPAFQTAEELAEKTDARAYIVCTPPATHEATCTALLERGAAVLCEKPLALDSGSAERMFSAAEQAGALLTMASKFRFCDDIVRAKSLIASGVLGELILFENAFTARVDMTKRWNSDPRVAGGGVLIDNGTHSVDLMRYFLGPLVGVHAVEGLRVQDLPVEDTVQIYVKSHGGVHATIDLSWSLNKERESFVDVYGSQGTVQVGWRRSRYRQATSQDWVEFGKGYDKVACFRGQMRNFVAAAQGREKPLIGPQDALASVAVVEAAYQSLRDSHWVEVTP